MDMGERLKVARETAGYDKAIRASEAMGVNKYTYAQHENGTRPLSREAGIRYAGFFRVNLEWLLQGKGEMKRRKPRGIPLLGTVGAGSGVEPIGDASWADAADYIDLPDPDEVFALKIEGDSAEPRYSHGDTLVVWREPVREMEMINRYCVLDLADGRRCAKKLLRDKGVYMLASENRATETEVAPLIVACYRIRLCIEA